MKFYLKDNKIVAQDDGNKVYFHYGVDGLVGFTYASIVIAYGVVASIFGGTAGFVAGGIGLMGEYYGNILGNTLSNMTILSSGIKLSKIINPSIIISSISTMFSIVAGIGSGILIQNLFYNENDMYENATNSLKDEIKSIIYEIFRYFALQ